VQPLHSARTVKDGALPQTAQLANAKVAQSVKKTQQNVNVGCQTDYA